MSHCNVILSRALCQKLVRFSKEEIKEPIVGPVFGWFNNKIIRCLGCAMDNPNVLLPFGYDIVGVFCYAGNQAKPEEKMLELCQPVIMKYQDQCHRKGMENIVFMYTYPSANETVYTKLISLDLETPAEANSVSMTDNIFTKLCTVRARGAIPFPFEINKDKYVFKLNLETAASRIKNLFLSGVLAFQMNDTRIMLKKDMVDIALSDLLKQIETDNYKGKKKKTDSMEFLNFSILNQATGDLAVDSCGTHFTPVIHYQKKAFKSATVGLTLDVVAMLDVTDPVSKAVQVLTDELCNQVDQMSECILKFSQGGQKICTPQPFHFFPSACGHWVTVFYPSGVPEKELASYRRELHRLLLLPTDRPIFRRVNKYSFPEDLQEDPFLRNTHLGLAPPLKDCQIALVEGDYVYHHYMQGHFDDNHWGCAYRSLQTIVSWFRLQGYTEIPVPTHKEIQQALVSVGDKQDSFIGSKQWIGSQEVGYCLNELIGVMSRTIHVSSGKDLPTKARELLNHFQNQGTPIMIGGGQLAHTIIGIAFNEKTGETKYLILDPHYTGQEDLSVIQNKGWCGWKGDKFWNQNQFYNLCLPMRPKNVI